MNLGEIVEAATAQVIALSNTEQLVNAAPNFVKAMVNKGYHLVERSALWKFSEAEAPITYTAGTREATQPDDLGVPLMVYDAQGHPLTYWDDRQAAFPPSDTGEPRYYSVWEDTIRLWPLPKKEGQFTLRYYKQWPDLVGDADEPIIPNTFHDLLVDYGSYQLALRLPATGDRFLPFSQAQPYIEGFQTNLALMLGSDLVMKTWDEVPNYGFIENVLGLGEW